MYNRLTVYHNLHNLIWVLSSSDPAWYPGDDVVDIVGVDAYPSDVGDALVTSWQPLLARLNGVKPIALTEFGGVPDIAWGESFGVWWAYFVSWTGSYGPESMPAATVAQIYQSSPVITLDELNAIPPQITAGNVLGNGNFQLSGTGRHGGAFRVLGATNIGTPSGGWPVLGSGTFTGGVFTFTDPQSTNFEKRFYRTVSP